MSKHISKRVFASEHPRHVLLVPYCGLQYLMQYEPILGHSERIEGWACDYYRIPHTNYYISTGYDAAGMKTPLYKSGLYRKYEKAALEYNEKTVWTDTPHRTRVYKHRRLMIAMLREALGKEARKK